MSAIISTAPYKCQFNQQGNKPGTNECQGPDAVVQGGITAAMPGGSWLGALISGVLTDMFGRKTSIQIGAIIWIIGSIIICAAQNIPMLIVGRIINGISVGICSAQVPVYISELSPPSKRGRFIGMQQWAITWGIAIMFFVCYGSSFIDGAAAFRLPWGLQMIPAILLFFGLTVLPESPRWLAKHDRWEEAKEVLILVHGQGNPDSQLVAKEMAEIKEAVDFERQNADVSYLELFRPKMINRTHIGIFTQIWSQLTGMNVMMYYISYIFTMTGSGDDVLLPSGIQWGRRPTMLIGAFFMCLWLCINAGLFAVYSHAPAPHQFDTAAISMVISGRPAKAVIASTYLFVASYAPTWGPCSWTYPAELYPLRVRGKAVALATSANWAFNFALAYFVPPAFANITLADTSNKTLEEVAATFEDDGPGSIKYIGVPAWKTHNDRSILRIERNLVSSEEKIGIEHSTSAKI
ncbi:High-affinity glucose transporter [Daldinia childiae]|uniref:High-affinity glucose transporter n=1 Tax=Daldinia childiae TaxID=326645 RepID=UPI00144796AD|nr:High-affinity glucose transporter [Daldinia childiae]KAF3057940.1 High-affinity glucose transporter [Daldinia childiae]